jgi:hypothetical protein
MNAKIDACHKALLPWRKKSYAEFGVTLIGSAASAKRFVLVVAV